MRYRALDINGDYTFGGGAADFLVNSPATVGQAVMTRLRLLTGEWFLDTTEGTPYATQVLGRTSSVVYDAAIRQRILQTQGVTAIDSYSSKRDPGTRLLTISATITTTYGRTTVQGTL